MDEQVLHCMYSIFHDSQSMMFKESLSLGQYKYKEILHCRYDIESI